MGQDLSRPFSQLTYMAELRIQICPSPVKYLENTFKKDKTTETHLKN
jgi:hypothetical protein